MVAETLAELSVIPYSFGIASSFDNCADQSELEFYIFDPLSDTPLPSTFEEVIKLPQVITYDCIRVGNQSITVFVVDPEGNYDFATTTISIQDNAKICEGLFEEPVPLSLIAGSVQTTAGKMVEDVTVTVNGGRNSLTTEADGAFQFTLANGDDYTLTPEKNIDPLNGVSTFDLVLINKHILGITSLDSPYKYIAADINQSGTITAFDMVQLRRLILNISTEFPNNDSWRFVDASFEFSDTPLSDNFNEHRSVNNLKDDMMHNDFIAIKIGDVTTSWNKTNQTNHNSKLFTLNCVATTSGQLSDILSISSDITAKEAYDETGEIMDIALQFNTNNAVLGFELNQNAPNPFRGETVIGFTMEYYIID